MRNKIVGLIVVGIALLMGFIIYSFNRAMTNIVGSACSHGSDCVMWDTLSFQTNLSIGIMIFVVFIGLYLIFFSNVKIGGQQVRPKEISRENYKEVLDKLSEEGRLVLEKVIDAKGSIFQSDLVEKTEFTKVKITRILDGLEGRRLIERKRRGMTNVVILKDIS
jgi:uncharacterized membrane protein